MATQEEIAWAAGIYEGEGHTTVPTRINRTTMASVTQKDGWLLYKMQSLFGGSVKFYQQKYKEEMREYGRWHVCGINARAFFTAIFPYLSPRRQEQINRALAGRQDYVRGPYETSVTVRL